MTDRLVLGVDLGVSGARAAVMDGRARIVASGARFAVPTRSSFGRAEQAPSAWIEAVAAAMADALAAAPGAAIGAIGVSALGPAPVLVDDALAAVAPALLFSQDTRAEAQRRALCIQLGLRDDELNHDHAIPKLEWWRECDPERFERASLVMDATGFIVAQLTGEPTMDTITACDYALPGVSCPLPLPPVRDAYSVAGGLTPAWAARIGLSPGVPVMAGTYDAYADTAAIGATHLGDGCVIFGSTLIIGAILERAPADMFGMVAAPHLGEGVMVGGWTATGGSALGWARRLLGAPDEFEDALETAAGALPAGAGGLLFLPYLTGERSPVHDPDARGVVLGLSVDTRPEHLYRAVIDGVALSVRDHAERLRALGVAPALWRGGGGGARNATLVRATSDAIQEPLEIAADAGAPIGPCRIALRGLGIDPPVTIVAVVEPDPAAAERVDRLYAIYRSLYVPLAGSMHDLTDLNNSTGGGR